MKATLQRAALALTAVLSMMAAPATAQTAFEFRGETTSAVVDLATKPACRGFMSPSADGTFCIAPVEVAGVSNVLVSTRYYEGRMNLLGGTFNPRGYVTILNAFSEKYGPPELTNPDWQSTLGATFPNTVATWIFSDGTLTLKLRGSRQTESQFIFEATVNQPPVAPPVVNF